MNYKKYPRTYHLPWSLGKTDDDKTLKTTEIFKNKKVVVTLKMDGENTTLYKDYMTLLMRKTSLHLLQNL